MFYFTETDTMGNAAQYGPSFRDVSIRISGDFVRDVPSWVLPLAGVFVYGIADAGKNANGIKSLLNNSGWIVEAVSDQSSWFGGEDIFQIDAVVAINYSDAEILQSLRTALASLFVVTGISMITPPYTVPSGTTPTYTNTPPATYTPPPGQAATPGGSILPTIPSGTLNSFAAGLGVSVPIMLLGGAILLVVITRK